ncbi:cysteine desulfurase [Gordoniibacillus kamchatkensis]|uniref:cysteine desulfurase n=1 Tax=Gordoniibacillus kamchatkensis TaxID=1590651 RepID=A0ABR5AJB1_9BACL|nr:cysteine desulfurase family protein [Paenibacillus sp. VKM B-2647]KIL41061.1 cysteine desulfurase [Paenibacillus sp. VKM B-2647]
MDAIYLDNAATTPMHPEVLEAMLPYFREHYGNPSSIHSFGRDARTALNRARDGMAAILGCKPGELIYTSGGTESNNTAIFGAVSAAQAKRPGVRPHIVTTAVEHHAVLHPCERLEQLGCDVTYVAADSSGLVNASDVEAALRPETALISVMYVNNEVGTVQPIEAIGTIARERGIPFHVDAVQALGKLPLKLDELPVDLMSLSAHKIYGPKGVGLLYMRSTLAFPPYLYGGNQERKRRSGTENVAGIVGFAKAAQLFAQDVAANNAAIERLRDTLLQRLAAALGPDGFAVSGHPVHRVPHIINISFFGLDTETLLMNLDLEGVAASSGSACTAGSLETSHVLQAMNLPDEVTRTAIRFSLGLGNSIPQVEKVADIIATIRRRLTYR